MKHLSLIIILVLFLSSCGLRRKDLGMEASKPNQSQVHKREKLTLPPDYDTRPQQRK